MLRGRATRHTQAGGKSVGRNHTQNRPTKHTNPVATGFLRTSRPAANAQKTIHPRGDAPKTRPVIDLEVF